jgi:hypothetical protein
MPAENKKPSIVERFFVGSAYLDKFIGKSSKWDPKSQPKG